MLWAEKVGSGFSWRIPAGILGLALGFGGTNVMLLKRTESVRLLGSEVASGQQIGKGHAVLPEGLTYRNCDTAWATGAAPVRKGEPGYSRNLDRDGDGVGCEP